MLQSPYTHYERLYVYHLDLKAIPEVNDPDLIGIWVEDDMAVLFFHHAKEELVTDICKKYSCNVVYQADMEYRDWEAGQEISAFSAGNITVAPVWQDVQADIRLDPSVIFGTGFHPTTRVCLELLLKYCTVPEIEIDSVLDLGTGTGLLGIAAAMHGAKKVTAVDNNPLACQVALANTKRNNVHANIDVHQLDLRTNLPETNKYDLVVANLYKGLLEELFENPKFWQAGLYILSGFIHSMEEDLLAAFPTESMRFLDRKRADKWCIWVLANREKYGL
jgi:ribosomal protein L11 methyltransferase